jgi:hypothetical protein
MSVTNVQPPDKSIFEDAALETGIAAPFVEKDWYVTQVISALSAIETDGYEIIFSGGTALSKAHGLLQRFSEDIDFRVLTENTGRKALSAYKNTVIEKLRESGFDIEDHQIKARDGNRYFSIDLDYKTQFERPDALRPHVQIELTARDIQLPAVYLPVYSFVSRLTGHDPEVASIGCIDPVESAADKLSALAWRIPDRVRGGKYDDPAIVRHIHDLAVLKDAAMNNDDFAGLVLSSMSHDDRRSKNNPDFAGLPVDEKFKQMFEILDTDQEYRREYEKFVKGVSYAPEGDVPGYDAALDAVRILAKSVIS